jgi:hypothetical protein
MDLEKILSPSKTIMAENECIVSNSLLIMFLSNNVPETKAERVQNRISILQNAVVSQVHAHPDGRCWFKNLDMFLLEGDDMNELMKNLYALGFNVGTQSNVKCKRKECPNKTMHDKVCRGPLYLIVDDIGKQKDEIEYEYLNSYTKHEDIFCHLPPKLLTKFPH